MKIKFNLIRRSYSFIRGQNAPIDPNTLAERTTKRLKAIEFQNAIKEQLRERETIKRLEHERILLEERRQEDRVRKQMEAEQIRVEAEQRKHQDKIETEIKKQMAMKIAIEKARQEAELEKARRRRESHLNLENVATNECNDESNVSIDVPKCEDAPESDNENGHIGAIETPSPTMDIDERHDDDGEKILIGTPIKMKKKTIAKLNLSQHANGKRVESPMATNQMNVKRIYRIKYVAHSVVSHFIFISIFNFRQKKIQMETNGMLIKPMPMVLHLSCKRCRPSFQFWEKTIYSISTKICPI